MFLVARYLIGFGLVFANAFAPILIGELSHPKDRQVTTSLYQTTWYCGATLAAWTTFGTFTIPTEWAWRIPSLLQAAPALVQIVGIFFVPESPRWLIAKNRGEEAKKILTKYHAEGYENDELVALEYFEMKRVIEADLLANKMTWRAFVSSAGNRRRLLLVLMLGLFSQWSGNGLVSYVSPTFPSVFPKHLLSSPSGNILYFLSYIDMWTSKQVLPCPSPQNSRGCQLQDPEYHKRLPYDLELDHRCSIRVSNHANSSANTILSLYYRHVGCFRESDSLCRPLQYSRRQSSRTGSYCHAFSLLRFLQPRLQCAAVLLSCRIFAVPDSCKRFLGVDVCRESCEFCECDG